MTDSGSSDRENEMIAELMVEGFGYPLPHRRELLELPANLVTVANQVTMAVPPQGDAGFRKVSLFKWRPLGPHFGLYFVEVSTERLCHVPLCRYLHDRWGHL